MLSVVMTYRAAVWVSSVAGFGYPKRFEEVATEVRHIAVRWVEARTEEPATERSEAEPGSGSDMAAQTPP